MSLSKIKLAGARINGGAWVRNIPVDGFDGIALKVRGANNADARLLRDKLVRDLPKGRDAGMEDLDRLNDRVLSEAILIDWNLSDDVGTRISCTREKVAELLADPDVGPLLREAVSWASASVGARGEAETGEAAKN